MLVVVALSLLLKKANKQKEQQGLRLDKSKQDRINANVKFIEDHFSDHSEFGKVSPLIGNKTNELMPKFVLHPSQLKRLYYHQK